MALNALLQALWQVPTSTWAYGMMGTGVLTFGLLMTAPSLTAPYGGSAASCPASIAS